MVKKVHNVKGELERIIKTPGAILMGLGSIVGTGIFVSVAIATQVAGNGIIIAIVISGLALIIVGLVWRTVAKTTKKAE